MGILSSIRDIKLASHPYTSKVYGFGGYVNDTLSNSILEYDFRSGSYNLLSPSGMILLFVFTVGSSPCARVHHAICMGLNSLYVYGGLDADQHPLNDLWRFDIKSQVWKQVSMSPPYDG